MSDDVQWRTAKRYSRRRCRRHGRLSRHSARLRTLIRKGIRARPLAEVCTFG